MTQYDSGQILFRVYGIEADDLPEDFYDMDEQSDYPAHGADHEAHDAANVVFEALKSTDRFEWSDGITGVALDIDKSGERQ